MNLVNDRRKKGLKKVYHGSLLKQGRNRERRESAPSPGFYRSSSSGGASFRQPVHLQVRQCSDHVVVVTSVHLKLYLRKSRCLIRIAFELQFS